MKKILSVLLVACLCLSAGAMLLSCDEGHTHRFGTTWISDATSHWHECEEAACLAVSDQAAHIPANGACTVCGASVGTADEGGEGDEGNEGGGDTFAGISEEKWEAMLSAASFENYTLTTEGEMTVSGDGQAATTAKIKSVCKITADRIGLYLYSEENGEMVPAPAFGEVFDGEIADAQRLQYSQIFLLLLRNYEHFTYDAVSGIYRVSETVTISENIKGITTGNTDVPQLIEVPAVIEMRDAEVTISEDGKLLKLVCDYTQTMEMGQNTVTTAGITTWTFTDYGTTVID